MEINRMIASLAAGLLLLSFEGCSDAPREQGADLKPAVEKPSAVSFDRETKRIEALRCLREANVVECRHAKRGI